MAKFIVTVTPPTPNGDLHLGHLSGPFLAADIMQRYLKHLGHDVLFITYSDDYQSYLPRKTQVLRRKPFAYARLMHQAIKLSLELVDIRFDTFMQAADNQAYQHSGEYYANLISGQTEFKAYKTFYCSHCNLYGYEGFGRTQCNWCGTSSDASQCEHCARIPDIEKINAMNCMSCMGKMQPVQIKQHIWKVGQNYSAVKTVLHQNPMRNCLKSYLAEVLTNEDEQWLLTRPGDAGLKVAALNNYPVHTWFLGLAGYRGSVESYLTEHPERGEFTQWWSPDTTLVQFLGFDCSYSHAVGYSTLLLADKKGPRPGIFITNRFLKLDGEDFSTSRGHAVWIKDLAGQYPSDAIRLFCALTAPETEVSNFSRAQFLSWYNETFLPITQQVVHINDCAAILTKSQRNQIATHPSCLRWQKAASIAFFSIADMAQAALDISAVIMADDQLSVAPEAWRILADMLQPLCPDLADTIIYMASGSVTTTKVFDESA